MKIKKTKPVKPEVNVIAAIRVDEHLFFEDDIVTVKYSRDDDILTATGRIAYVGGVAGITGPYIRLDCSSEWHCENVIVDADEILDCKYYFQEAVSYCINDVESTKAVVEACK